MALLMAVPFNSARPEAQSLMPGPPGPFVFDVSVAMSGVPAADALFAGLPAGTLVPTRAFGGGGGAHVYALQIGPSRLGFGIGVLVARGSTPEASSTVAAVDPQISFNFGTADGWSFLSAGIGAVHVSADPGSVSETVRSVNWGGGARWFLGPHLGVGFDVRVRHLAAGDAVPKGTTVSGSVGVSLK
jgi:hypothetical protein